MCFTPRAEFEKNTSVGLFPWGSCFEGRLASPSNTLQWLLTTDVNVLLWRVDCHMEKTRWPPCYVACHAWGVWGFKGNRQGNTALCTKIGCCLWFFLKSPWFVGSSLMSHRYHAPSLQSPITSHLGQKWLNPATNKGVRCDCLFFGG